MRVEPSRQKCLNALAAGAVHLSMRYLHTLIGEIAVAMAGRVIAWHVGDTQHPYPTRSELVR